MNRKKNTKNAGKNTDPVQNTGLCIECSEEVLSDDGAEDGVQCDKCRAWIHESCTGLNKRQFVNLSAPGITFNCKKCISRNNDRARKSLPNLQYNSIMEKLNELTSVKSTVEDLKESVSFVSLQNDDIVCTMKKFQAEINKLKKENEIQKAELESIKKSVNGIEAVQLRKQCFLKADERLIKENVKTSVADIMNKAGCNLKEEDIEFAAVQNKLSHEKSKVVKVGFQTFDAKLKVMKSKKKLKEEEGYKEVVIYDVLNQDTLKIYNYAKELTKLGYHAVFTIGSRVLARKQENGTALWLKSKKDVDELITEAVGGARGRNNVTLRKSQNNNQQRNSVGNDVAGSSGWSTGGMRQSQLGRKSLVREMFIEEEDEAENSK